ncbi:MAG: stage III sporulation protein AB [Ruminococcus flavefaciens]|nr:stage III sporulation protein AB [Ruminococcus flavefaciens]MCM1229732.1 stage III sporulation protein AB [Ruminococcus flavefaciens]
MMFRIFLALALTSAGGITGFCMADKLRESRKICDEINHLFQQTAFFINYRQDDVYAICRHLKADSELKDLTFLNSLPDFYSTGEDFHRLWTESLESQKNLSREEADILAHFGCILGKSDAESQSETILGLQKELGRITEIRTENLLKKGRLYRSAGLLFGVMAGILVI